MGRDAASPRATTLRTEVTTSPTLWGLSDHIALSEVMVVLQSSLELTVCNVNRKVYV